MRQAALSWVFLLPWKKVGMGVAAFVGLTSCLLLLSNGLQGRTVARLNARWQVLQPERTQLDRVQSGLLALKNRATVLKGLKAPEAQWAPRLNLLCDALVSQLWFSSLQFGPADIVMEQLSPKGKGAAAKKPAPAKGSAENPQESKKSTAKKSAPPKPALNEKDQAARKSAPKKGEEGKPPPPAPPLLLLKGSAFVSAQGAGAPVSRYLQHLKEHPEFKHWFRSLELKSVEQRQIQQEQVSDFVIALYPTGM